MVEINWTYEAELWLKDIHDYIALDKKTIAKKVVVEIFNKVQIRQSFPKIGYEYPNNENNEIRICANLNSKSYSIHKLIFSQALQFF